MSIFLRQSSVKNILRPSRFSKSRRSSLKTEYINKKHFIFKTQDTIILNRDNFNYIFDF